MQARQIVKSLAVLHASQLVTLAGPQQPRVGSDMSDLAIIRDGGMLITDGKIDIVGSSDRIERNASSAEIIDAGGRVVLPGFVAARTGRKLRTNCQGRRRDLVNGRKNARGQRR